MKEFRELHKELGMGFKNIMAKRWVKYDKKTGIMTKSVENPEDADKNMLIEIQNGNFEFNKKELVRMKKRKVIK